MRLDEIRVGEFYAVSVNEKQVDLEDFEDEYALRRKMALGRVRPGWYGYKARVVGIERNEAGRDVVRVELVGYWSRQVEDREEDNGDGTRTIWRGHVVDEDGRSVMDEETSEAVIHPRQVKLD